VINDCLLSRDVRARSASQGRVLLPESMPHPLLLLLLLQLGGVRARNNEDHTIGFSARLYPICSNMLGDNNIISLMCGPIDWIFSGRQEE